MMKSTLALMILCSYTTKLISSAPDLFHIPILGQPEDQTQNHQSAQLGKFDQIPKYQPQSPNSERGNWQDNQNFVTSDGKGKASFQSGQKIFDNGFTKFAQHSVSYGSNANYKPEPNDHVLNHDDFQRRQKELHEQMMGSFKPLSFPNFNVNPMLKFSMPSMGSTGRPFNPIGSPVL